MTKELLNAAATRIHMLRRALGLNRREFCELINYSESHLANVENGRQRVPQELFRALCETWPMYCLWFVVGSHKSDKQSEPDFFSEKGLKLLIKQAMKKDD